MSSPRLPAAMLAGIALSSCSLLLYELILMRIFSVTVWYYFGFLAVSLAMAGVSWAGVRCAIRFDEYAGRSYRAHFGRFTLAFALLAPAAVWLHLASGARLSGPAGPGLIALLLAQVAILIWAFFAAGMCAVLPLARAGTRLGTPYAANLAGSAAGALLAPLLLFRLSAPAIVWVVSALAAAAGWCAAASGPARLRKLAAIACAASVVLAAGNDRWGILRIRAVKSTDPARLQEPEPAIEYERWSPVARVAVSAPERIRRIEYRWMTSDSKARTPLRRFDGDLAGLTVERARSWQLVHRLKPDADVLIIGSGGGDDVLTALAAGQRSVTAVEINPVIADLVLHRYADYIGRIFQHPRVRLHVAEGRSFVAASPARYDAIQITMIDSWAGSAAGAYVFNENYLYTVEAVRDYLAHLSPGGWLSMTRYVAWEESARLSNLLLEALGSGDPVPPSQRILVVTEPPHRYQRTTVLVKAGAVSPAETALAVSGARDGRYAVVHAPGARADLLDGAPASERIRAMIRAADESSSARDAVVRAAPRNLRAPTDDRPFFFFTHRFRDLWHVDRSEHASRRSALAVLAGVAGVLGVAAGGGLAWGLRGRGGATDSRRRLVAYAASIGAGFMLLELSIIPRFAGLLGHPMLAYALGLAALLSGGGAGSWWVERRLLARPTAALSGVLSALVATGLVMALVLFPRLAGWMGLAKPLRLLFAAGLLTSLGFLMGICLPLGIRAMPDVPRTTIPWVWGLNGLWSVWASALALLLSIFFGFQATLLAGAACYAIALALVLGTRPFPVER